MSEYIKEPQLHREKDTAAHRLRKRLDRLFHPISSAREDQFTRIIAVLPDGAMKDSFRHIQPKLREMLKFQNIDTLTSEVITRTVAFGAGALFTAVGSAFGWIGSLHTVVGLGLMTSAFLPWGVTARARREIANETAMYESFYQTHAGQDAARVWDQKPGGNVDQIVRTMILGTPSMRGTPGSMLPLPGIPTAGGPFS